MNASDKAKEFLAETNVCVLATTGSRGYPHAMPVWYLYHEGDILILAGRDSQKVKNIERTGKATVVVDRRELPYYAVMIRGTATIEPSLSGELRFALVSRYLGDEPAREYIAGMESRDVVTIRVRPERFVEYDGRAGSDDAAESG